MYILSCPQYSVILYVKWICMGKNKWIMLKEAILFYTFHIFTHLPAVLSIIFYVMLMLCLSNLKTSTTCKILLLLFEPVSNWQKQIQGSRSKFVYVCIMSRSESTCEDKPYIHFLWFSMCQLLPTTQSTSRSSTHHIFLMLSLPTWWTILVTVSPMNRSTGLFSQLHTLWPQTQEN